MKIEAVILDMDGTIWDGPIDWLEVRSAIGLPKNGKPILAHLDELAPDERARGFRILHSYEEHGVKNGKLMPGAQELLRFLKDRRIRCALVSNNSRRNVQRVIELHDLRFDLVISRDDGVYKPSPEPLLRALRGLEVEAREAIAIGDAHLDLLAAHYAGIDEIVLVATKEWMLPLIPDNVGFRKVADLYEAQSAIAELLT